MLKEEKRNTQHWRKNHPDFDVKMRRRENGPKKKEEDEIKKKLKAIK